MQIRTKFAFFGRSLHSTDYFPVHHKSADISTLAFFNIFLNKDVVAQTIERFNHRRSEEHTSELQSREDVVCRLLPEKQKRSRFADFPRSAGQTCAVVS